MLISRNFIIHTELLVYHEVALKPRPDKYKIVKDPVHGYIRIYAHELPIVDTLAFQRLRRIKQLSMAYLVYPGAQHTRFEHSLGVAHVVETMMRELLVKAGVTNDDFIQYVVLMRLLALLHDIGHGPFSHTFEGCVLIPKGLDHELMSANILLNESEITGIVEDLVEEYGYKVNDVAAALASKSIKEWPFGNSFAGNANEKALFYILKGAFSGDTIDYLLRDSYFTGAGYSKSIDWIRLAHFSEIHEDKIVVDERALEVVDQVLIARVFMFSTVYYHKKVRAIEKLVCSLLENVDRIMGLSNYVKNVRLYMELDDYFLLSHPEIRRLPEAKALLSRRIPFKAVAEHKFLLHGQRGSIAEMAGFSARYLEQKMDEVLMARGIELKPGRDYFVDTPKLPLNPMLQDEYIFIKHGHGVLARHVTEFTWLYAPSMIAVVRLYLDKNKMEYVDEVIKVFNDVLRSLEEIQIK
ncbi:MAG: hypothetical protein DRO12_00245 [Thermoprotei archaeon]|nr:MAG: hypothetical protein DRO12_00245 [Thermoprotei archaeon]